LERPYRIDRHYWYPSWLERFEGRHPDEVVNMMDDVRSGRVATELRPTNDVEKLLDSRLYRLGAFVLKAIDPLDRLRLWVRLQLVRTKNVCCSASRR
jgi:hypothetical protein